MHGRRHNSKRFHWLLRRATGRHFHAGVIDSSTGAVRFFCTATIPAWMRRGAEARHNLRRSTHKR